MRYHPGIELVLGCKETKVFSDWPVFLYRSLEEHLPNHEGTKEIFSDEAELEHISLQLDHADGTHLEGR